MAAVAAYMRLARKRHYADPRGGRALLDRPKGSHAPPRRVERRVSQARERVDGFEVYVVRPHRVAAGEGPAVVYLHGGAYVSEIVEQQWSLVADLAERVGVEVQVPIYGLAPHHHAAEALDLVLTVLARLAATRRPTYLVGDSAGGGLALLAAQHTEVTTVRGMTLMSPWLDLTMANPEIAAVERRDPWLARAALHEVAESWAAGTPLDDPRVSPLYGRLEGLPPIDLWVGERDITLPDCRLLRDRVGGPLAYHEEPGALHVYPILPVPEGRAARGQVLRRVAAALRDT